MKLYRFSPIQSKEQLLEAIQYTHMGCYTLCKQSFGKYLPNAGNIGIFCHYNNEFEFLVKVREELTEPSGNPNQKYFKLRQPITIAAEKDIPQAIYTHLYIRKPDPYRAQVGDVDFYLEPEKYLELKQSLISGKQIAGARIFPRQDLDMVELHNPDVDALAYVSPKTMTEKVRVKQSNETNL
jgi:hypothetical protein